MPTPDHAVTAAHPTVLDVSVDIAGQYAGRLLGRHGFNVVRAALHHPAAKSSLIFDGPAASPDSAFRRFLDQGKRIVDVDLGDSAGFNALGDLVGQSDIVLSTFEVDASVALGLDGPSVRRLNPSAALVSVTPYGLRSPHAGRPATEQSLFAHAGGMLISGAPSGPPLCPNLPIASMLGGIYTAMAALLCQLAPGGSGVSIDIALMDVVAANLERVLSYYTYLEAVPYRGAGSGRLEQSAGGGFVRAADGYFYIFSGYQWLDRVLEMVGRSDLSADAAGGEPASRREQAKTINAAVTEAVATLTVDQLAKRAQELRMPSGPVATASLLLQDAQLQSRRMFVPTGEGGVDIQEPFRFIAVEEHIADEGAAPSRVPGRAGDLPLAGIRVLDFTHAFAGPTSSRLLAEAGADVIKIESVNRLDLLARGMLPFDNDTSGDWWERSGYYGDRNLGKRAITLDMSRPEGRDLFLRLATEADVIVANFTPRVLRDWGLEPERLVKTNPRLVVLMMTGFGLSGPKRDNPALAGTMEAASGFSSFVRRSDDEKPGALGFNFGDMVSGLYGGLAVLLALHRRQSTGVGQIIDFACAEAPVAFVANQVLDCWDTATEPTCTADYLHAGTHVLIESGDRPEGQRWVLAYLPPGGPTVSDLVADQELRLSRSGGSAVPDLLTTTHDRDNAVQLLQQRGLVAVPLATAEDLWYDSGLRSRDFFVQATRRSTATMPHSRGLPILRDGRPLSGAMYSIPLLGEHNWELLGQSLGLTPESFALLEDTGIIGTRPRGKLPRTFQVPLALDQLEELGLIERRPGVRSQLIASFAEEVDPRVRADQTST